MKNSTYLIPLFLLFSIVCWSCFPNLEVVGHSDFKEKKPKMEPFAEKAYAYPSQPGTKGILVLEDDKLVLHKHGPTYFRMERVILRHEQTGKKFVTFDTGGGHLGRQGYVYVENSDPQEVLRVVLYSNDEEYKVQHLAENWFLYDSLVE